MVFIAGASVAFFLSILIFLKHKKNLADKVLMAWLFTSAVHQLLFYFDNYHLSTDFSLFAGLNMPIPFLHGPFLFLYVSFTLGSKPRLKWIHLLHFMPFLVSIAVFLPFYLEAPEVKVFNLQNQMIEYKSISQFNYLAMQVSGYFYLLLSFITLFRTRRCLKNKNEPIDQKSRIWLPALSISLLFIWIFISLGNLQYLFIFVSINTFLIGIIGLKSTPYIFTLSASYARDLQNTLSAQKVARYERSGLTPQKKLQLIESLESTMKVEKAYTDSELSLEKLARELDTHPNYLSQLINEQYHVSYNDLINKYRVEEFLTRLHRDEHRKYSFLALSLDCGFNSKASFNRNFKKLTGLTPTEYLEIKT